MLSSASPKPSADPNASASGVTCAKSRTLDDSAIAETALSHSGADENGATKPTQKLIQNGDMDLNPRRIALELLVRELLYPQ